MGRIAVLVAVGSMLALPAMAAAKPVSFQAWTERWSAHVANDNARVANRCLGLYGANDLALGMCWVKAGRANLRAERALWEQQVASVARGQEPVCKDAIHDYVVASRLKQTASLVYLDAHRRTPLSNVAGDISGEPYASLKATSDQARARAIAICR